jgi:hypothetical protein
MVDKNGNKVVFESLLEYQSTGNKEEREALKWFSENINNLEEAKRKAKTNEEKKEIDNQLRQYYEGQNEILRGIQQRGSLGGKYITGNYLLNSATGYDGKTLTVSNEKMSAEVGAEKIGIAIDGMGKIATELWVGKISNSGSKLSVAEKPKYLSEPAQENGTLNIGAGKNPTEGAYNIDYKNPNPEIGVHQGDGRNLTNVKTGSQSKVILENPFGFDPLNSEVNRVVKTGGTVEITANFSNKSANKYLNMTAQEFEKLGYELISKTSYKMSRKN